MINRVVISEHPIGDVSPLSKKTTGMRRSIALILPPNARPRDVLLSRSDRELGFDGAFDYKTVDDYYAKLKELLSALTV